MPIDKGSERGEQRDPNDWERINTEWEARDKAQRQYDATHDPGEVWERSARPLPEGYGQDRPASRTVTQADIDEMVGLWGQKAVDKQIASGGLVVEGAENEEAAGSEVELTSTESAERTEAEDAPRVPTEQVRELLDQLPAREEGRPTTALVLDSTGTVRTEQSGGVRDDRTPTAEAWIDEGGWKRSSRRIETHAEAKVLVDMIEGRLPHHVTLVINNEMCREVNPRVASCEAFIRESLPDGYSLRIYESNENEQYFKGTR